MDDGHRGGEAPRPAWQRVGWFVLLWAAGAGLLWLISLVIRWAVVPD
ncbi:DUF2474 domain-containing protein [Orrella daihaiensis]|uniref:DUF2474 domain-containing protein n=1 Tax=Orrella daihaiensis TaxID=2782176 RepID=A0ABY4AMM9_9BURK|nr:DUF2474 domain-containing protein [Orrella daihaiensis]